MPSDRRYTVEGYWDCQYCGSKGIKGRFKSCPGCGHPRDASVRFYTKQVDAAHAITREEFSREVAEADKNSHSSSASYGGEAESEPGAASLFDREQGQGRGDGRDAHDETDWYCDYCDSYNPATAVVCQFCGADRESGSGKTYQQTMGTMARTYDAKGNLVKERDLSKRADAPKPTMSAKPAPKRLGCLPRLLIGVGATLALLLIVGLIVSPKPRDITVAGFDWERTIAVEQLQTVKESDWNLPDGARLERKATEVRTYESVVDHYESVPYDVSEEVLDHYETYTTTVDNGDGTFDVEEHQEPVYRTETHTEYRREPVYREVPVYDTKYYYEIERWVHERDVTTNGDDHDPVWGEVELADATGAHGTGKEREGERSGTYGVTDTDGNRYTADEDYWNRLEQGQKVTVLVDGDGHIKPKE